MKNTESDIGKQGKPLGMSVLKNQTHVKLVYGRT